jgi:cold shock CspA family protein
MNFKEKWPFPSVNGSCIAINTGLSPDPMQSIMWLPGMTRSPRDPGMAPWNALQQQTARCARVPDEREQTMAAVRFEGKLKKWHIERGFGFIVVGDSGQDVFVHISAFPRDGRVPVVDDVLSFEVEPDGKGKKRAVRVRRAGSEASARGPSSRRAAVHLSRAPKSASPLGKLIVVALLGAVGWAGYSHFSGSKLKVPPDFRCDGRMYCSQMTSCREATLFLQNCPGMEMDGNHDGVPCEQQWCR